MPFNLPMIYTDLRAYLIYFNFGWFSVLRLEHTLQKSQKLSMQNRLYNLPVDEIYCSQTTPITYLAIVFIPNKFLMSTLY